MVFYINENNEVIRKETEIGTINLSEGLDEAATLIKMKFPKSTGNTCKVCVLGDEKDIPHLHIESLKNDSSKEKDKFSCCVQLLKNSFYEHA